MIRRRLSDEAGVAMVAAIIMMLIVAGIVTAISISTTQGGHSASRDAARLKAYGWAESAVADLEFRLASSLIGKHHPASTRLPNGDWLIGGASGTRRVSITNPFGGAAISGYYQVLPPENAEGQPVGGANLGLLHGDERQVAKLGSVDFVVRGWDERNPRPVTLKVTFRRGTLARYLVASDQNLRFDSGTFINEWPAASQVPEELRSLVNSWSGTLRYRGTDVETTYAPHIHTNNTTTANRAIDFTGSQGSDTYFSTVTGSCRPACNRRHDAHLNLGSANAAFNSVMAISRRAGYAGCNGDYTNTPPYYGVACAELGAAGLDPPYVGRSTRIWQVRLSGDRVRYRQIWVWARRDLNGPAEPRSVSAVGDRWQDLDLPDDTKPWFPRASGFSATMNGCNYTCDTDPDRTVFYPSPYPGYTGDIRLPITRRAVGALGQWRTYVPPRSGGALLFGRDVWLSGRMTSRPVTIMAKHSGVAARPASIYVVANRNEWQVGGTYNAARRTHVPVGIMAEGNVYIPSWSLVPQNEPGESWARNDFLYLSNVSIVAATGRFGLGSSMDSLKDSMRVVVAANGDPNLRAQYQNRPRYGTGIWAIVEGTVASAKRPELRVAADGETVGYEWRSYNGVPQLGWDPPPFVPVDKNWSLADWNEK